MAFVGTPVPVGAGQQGRLCLRNCVARGATHATASASSSALSDFGVRVCTRRTLLTTLVCGAAGARLAQLARAAETQHGTTTTGLEYAVVKRGDGPAPVVGDLVGIRFKGMYNGLVFDNLFDNPEPYFYRAGSDTVLKGIDEAVLLMRVGDVYDLRIPAALAFGNKGRRASAGKASIPGGATVDFTLELTTIPGKEDDLLEITSKLPDLPQTE